jgi:hypothetical protein
MAKDCRRRRAGGIRHGLKGETGTQAREAELFGHFPQVTFHEPRRTVHAPLAVRHAESLPVAHYQVFAAGFAAGRG